MPRDERERGRLGRAPRNPRLLITCEHGGNRIPAEYHRLFAQWHAALHTHKGYDPGALTLARAFASALGAELVYSTTSRLLVELNRSPHHRQLLSDATRQLSPDERDRVLERYYWPYRNRVEGWVGAVTKSGACALHVSSHSFTPRLNGVTRDADIGLLYDPQRRGERDFCAEWKSAIETANPHLQVRRNYPYRGSADGLTTHLRTLHSAARYCGIEIEVNQKHTRGDPRKWKALRELLVRTLSTTLERLRSTL
jgi:predicted N-formylglutamate amidohydrolase